MKREAFLAVLTGVVFGLILALGGWKMSQLVKNTSEKEVYTVRPQSSAKANQPLTITNPTNYKVFKEDKVMIKGQTSADLLIIISSNEKDYLLNSDKKGFFESEISLTAGINIISLISLKNLTKIEEKQLILVHSTEISNDQTTSYIGTITDILNNTIQIKDESENIKQISISKETSYINMLKKNVEVKQTDLAIGDYIVAMGLVNGNKVLKAKRILISSPVVEDKYEAKIVTIENLSKTKINDITLPKKWNGPDTKDLEIGQKIILVGLQNEDKFDIRSIFVIE